MVQKVLLGMKISLFYQEKSTGGAAGAGGKSCDEVSVQKSGQESFWAMGIMEAGLMVTEVSLGQCGAARFHHLPSVLLLPACILGDMSLP